MLRQLILVASLTNELEINVLVAIGAVTFPFWGLCRPVFFACNECKNIIYDKRLKALVQTYEKAEYTGGYWSR